MTYQKEVQKYHFDEQERGKSGKATCNVLKRLRENIAREYGFPYTSSKCDQETCISGTCPRCEAELQMLTEAYYKNKDKHSFKRSLEILAGALGGINISKDYFGGDSLTLWDKVSLGGWSTTGFICVPRIDLRRDLEHLSMNPTQVSSSVDKKQEEK